MHALSKLIPSKLRVIVSIATVVLFSFPALAEVLKVVVNDTIQPISEE